MKTNVMLAALLLGASMMVNANTIPAKTTTKEVKTTVVRKHKKNRKAKKATTTAEAAKPAAGTQK